MTSPEAVADNARDRPNWREVGAVAAALAIAALGASWRIASHAATHMVAPFGDPLLNAWTLAWGANRLPHGLRGFWDAPFFYPARDVLAYSEHLLGISLFTSPWQWLTGNPVLVYNLAYLGSTVLAGVGMYLLALELTRDRGAAVVAAVAFAFAPYRVSQVTHLQVLACGWMPVALWALHRYLRHGSWRALAAFTVGFVLQAWSNGYFLYFLTVPVAIVVGHGVWMQRASWRRMTVGLVAAGAAMLLLLAPVAAAYVRVRRTHGFHRSLGDMVQFSAVPRAFVTVAPDLWAWHGLLPQGLHERELFPGLVVVVLSLVATWAAFSGRFDSRPALRSAVRVYVVIVAIAAVLALGPRPEIPGAGRLPTGPYAFLTAVLPGMDGLRVPARVNVVVALGLSVLAALGTRALVARFGTPRRRAALAGALAMVVYVEGLSMPATLVSIPSRDMEHAAAAYGWLRSRAPGAVLEVPAGNVEHEIRYVYSTLAHGHRSVNGYSGYGSALQEFMSGPVTREPGTAPELLALLRDLGVHHVILHEELYPDLASAATVRDALREANALPPSPGTTTEIGPITIFELAGARPAPTPETPAPGGCRLSPRTFTLDASDNREALGRLVDGVTATRWFSGRPQRGDEWITVAFDRPRQVRLVRLVMDRRSYGDYPRELVVEGAERGRSWTPLWRGSGLGPLGLSLASPVPVPRIDVPLPSPRVDALRLRQAGATPRAWFWSIHELEIVADACE